jgi:hypothetical protein
VQVLLIVSSNLEGPQVYSLTRFDCMYICAHTVHTYVCAHIIYKDGQLLEGERET